MCYVAGRTLFPWTWTFPFSPLPISYCVAYIVSLWTRIRINTPRVASPKGRQIGPHSPFVFVCVSGQPRPLLSHFVSVLCFFVTLTRPTRSRLSPLATAVREPVRSAQLTISSPSRLDRCPITHTCGSGNNKPRTPLPVTLARVPSSGTSLGFYFYLAHF